MSDSQERMVHCRKFDKEMPGLEKPPFAGAVGEQIFATVSAEAWKQWSEDMQIKVLNEYRLNMGDPKDYQVLVDQMMLFLNLKDGEVVEVENEKRGRDE
jgi:Fe-S cluster biosynthesis and repair protein YggX